MGANMSKCDSMSIATFEEKYCKDAADGLSIIVLSRINPARMTQACTDIKDRLLLLKTETIKCSETLGCIKDLLKAYYICYKAILAFIDKNYPGLSDATGIITAQFVQDIHNLYDWFGFPYEHEKSVPRLAPDDITVIFYKWVVPAVIFIEFFIGILGNGLLVMIFARNKSMRNTNNAMIISLTAADILALLISMPVFFLAEQSNIKLVHSFYFFSQLSIFVSSYSVVALSVDRYRAISSISALRDSRGNVLIDKLKVPVVWVLGLAYAGATFVPSFGVESGWFNLDHVARGFVVYGNLVVTCILPGIIVLGFNISASRKLKKAANNIPGIKDRHEERIHNRILSSRALIGLVVLFVSSYLCVNVKSIFNYHIRNFGIPEYFHRAALWINVLALPLLNLNSSLNPLILYFLSSRYRKYFVLYLSCKFYVEE